VGAAGVRRLAERDLRLRHSARLLAALGGTLDVVATLGDRSWKVT
jgi:hypothetical protein